MVVKEVLKVVVQVDGSGGVGITNRIKCGDFNIK